MTKFIFVTGGVVSSLGKGIAAASLAAILESRGIKLTLLKLDPYINVDPGTMSPFQHGEVFVTEDGAETDLDLGHYERFVNAPDAASATTSPPARSTRASSARSAAATTSAARCRSSRTSPTRSSISSARSAGDADVAIVEIGGTVGDIESLPFLEAIRQMSLQLGRNNTCFMHLTLVPYIPSAGEIKTKPTQHSVKELREIGIQPDVVLCRADRPLPDDERRKIALFTNLGGEVGHLRGGRGLHLQDPGPAARAGAGRDRLPQARDPGAARQPRSLGQAGVRSEHPATSVDIALVGKYVDLTESYKSLTEALTHAGIHNNARVNIHYIDSEVDRARGHGAL